MLGARGRMSGLYGRTGILPGLHGRLFNHEDHEEHEEGVGVENEPTFE